MLAKELKFWSSSTRNSKEEKVRNDTIRVATDTDQNIKAKARPVTGLGRP
jgi:hypothetical protein